MPSTYYLLLWSWEEGWRFVTNFYDHSALNCPWVCHEAGWNILRILSFFLQTSSVWQFRIVVGLTPKWRKVRRRLGVPSARMVVYQEKTNCQNWRKKQPYSSFFISFCQCTMATKRTFSSDPFKEKPGRESSD